MKHSTSQPMRLEQQYGARNYEPLPVVITEAQGAWMTDADGNRHLDMLSAYSAMNHGHRYPRIIQALVEQASKVTLTSRAFHHDKLGPLYAQLAQFTGKTRFIPMNSGAEAVETALKAARRWAYRVKQVPADTAEIIVCENNFHGRTLSITSFSTTKSYKDGFGPFTPGFTVVPYGDLAALEKAIQPNTAAFLFEPIQGEAGIRIPPQGFVREAIKLCRSRRVLSIADEIQTGFGRTGAKLACNHEGEIPDVYILGKALGGGVLPISMVAADPDVIDLFEPGSHGSTFGGNPLACAVASAAIEALEADGLVERSRELGKYALEQLCRRLAGHPLVADIRGRGLLLGVELNVPARRYCERLMQLGLLCKETHDTVIRLAPPLIVTKEELDFAFDRLQQALTEDKMQ